MARGKILLVDDEYDVRGFLQGYLEDRDFNVVIAENGVEGLEKYEKESFDLVMSDMLMPKMMGIEFIRRIKEKNPDQKIIMLTGVQNMDMVEKAKWLGVKDYITKPVTLASIEDKINACFPEKR